jgi:acyl carrier protein
MRGIGETFAAMDGHRHFLNTGTQIMNDTSDRLRIIIAKAMRVAEISAGDAATLHNIGADALDCVCIAMEIENEFGVDVGDEDIGMSSTIGQLVAMVKRKLTAA